MGSLVGITDAKGVRTVSWKLEAARVIDGVELPAGSLVSFFGTADHVGSLHSATLGADAVVCEMPFARGTYLDFEHDDDGAIEVVGAVPRANQRVDGVALQGDWYQLRCRSIIDVAAGPARWSLISGTLAEPYRQGSLVFPVGTDMHWNGDGVVSLASFDSAATIGRFHMAPSSTVMFYPNGAVHELRWRPIWDPARETDGHALGAWTYASLTVGAVTCPQDRIELYPSGAIERCSWVEGERLVAPDGQPVIGARNVRGIWLVEEVTFYESGQVHTGYLAWGQVIDGHALAAGAFVVMTPDGRLLDHRNKR